MEMNEQNRTKAPQGLEGQDKEEARRDKDADQQKIISYPFPDEKGRFSPGDDVTTAVIPFMKTKRVFNIGKPISEQLRQGFKDAYAIFTLERFFIYP